MSAVSASAEIRLIQRLRTGDTTVLEELIAMFGARIYRVAYGITRSAGDAEEVMQDVFLAIFNKVGKFEQRAAPWTWIYRITTNAALNKRRSRREHAELPVDDRLPHYTEDGHRDGDREYLLRDWSATPEQQLLSQERRALVEAALDALPAHYRAVLILRDVEGLGNEEAAAVLGDSVDAVKARLHRARMALREDLTRVMPLRIPSSRA